MIRTIKHIIIILLVPVFSASAQEEFIFKINGNPISKSDFTYYFKQSKLSSAKEFLPTFIRYQQQLAEAKEMRIDTLSSYKLQLNYYKTLFSNVSKEKSLDTNNKSTWVKFYNIDKKLSQNAKTQFIKEKMCLMDSLYEQIKSGSDMNYLASKYSDDYKDGSLGIYPEYIKLNLLPNEVISKIKSSHKEQLIPPFISPSGIHLIKIIDIKDSVDIHNRADVIDDNSKDSAYPEKYLENDLLVSIYRNSIRDKDIVVNDGLLENYFKENISNYYYKEKLFKGAVIMCGSKKISKVIKKYLKKYPQEEWKKKIDDLTVSDSTKHVFIKDGIFKQGDNPYIDKSIFKSGDKIDVDTEYPYYFVLGKKLGKKPESYKDVIDSVTIDYLNYKEIGEKDALDKKYKVEINEDVLKTVNNSGSN